MNDKVVTADVHDAKRVDELARTIRHGRDAVMFWEIGFGLLTIASVFLIFLLPNILSLLIPFIIWLSVLPIVLYLYRKAKAGTKEMLEFYNRKDNGPRTRLRIKRFTWSEAIFVDIIF